MSDWSEFRDGASAFFDKATREAVRLGDTATLYVKLKSCEAKCDADYLSLGRLTYNKLRSGADNGAKIDEVMSAIDRREATASALRAEMERLKKKQKDD